MAITPRTVLSEPINLVMFALSGFTLLALVGICAGRDDASPASDAVGVGTVAPDVEIVETTDTVDWPLNVDEEDAGVTRLDYTCRLVEPRATWSGREWLRHIHCMSARGESDDVLLTETSAAIAAVGLTPDLAVTKADYLARVGTADEQIAFLDSAVQRLGVVDGRLVHRLARALVWRGHQDDLEQVRHLELLSRMLMPDSCEVRQTDVWARYMLARDLARHPSPAAWAGVRRAVEAYVDAGCYGRLDQASPAKLAEVVGVGIAAEATNGQTSHSSLIRKVAEARDIKDVAAMCRDAVPDDTGLRRDCQKRLGDELYLAR